MELKPHTVRWWLPMSKLTLGSLFDGSGGFPLGAVLNGIIPVWASEIEPFPIRVTTKRLPFVKHYGDINKINGAEIEPVDIITFGSPCTDMSVAGKRKGINGTQSVLFYEAIRIIKEMRCKTNGKYPRFIVFENVPGAFSSTMGKDFREILNEIAKIKDETVDVPLPEKWKWLCAGEIVGDAFSIAWRTIDAQFWGVPQRRRRIYLVADFTDQCAGKILFESESVSGYSSQSIQQRQTTAGNAEDCIGAPVCFEPGAASRLGGHCWKDSTCTLRADMGDNQLAVAIENHTAVNGILRAYGICSDKSNSMLSDNPNSGIYEADTSRTLDKTGGNPACNQGGIAVVALQGSMIGRTDINGPNGDGINENIAFTLNATDIHAVAFAMTTGCYPEINREITAPLMARDYKDAQIVTEPASFYPQMKAESQCYRHDGTANTIVNGTNPGFHNGIVDSEYIVRRLTPTECALLQGFPADWCRNLETANPTEEEIDWWSRVLEEHRIIIGRSKKTKSRSQIVKWLKNPYSDAAEYKMWGNGVALPCVCFVLAGIAWITKNNA
jgi:DNA (cytosine-5)-methyltransferase 1